MWGYVEIRNDIGTGEKKRGKEIGKIKFRKRRIGNFFFQENISKEKNFIGTVQIGKL